nr:AsmA family protein [uncultured Dongia sp.]
MRRIIYLLLGFLAVLLLVLLGGTIWLTNADLKPWAEKAASDALGRKVVAAELEITWGNPLHVELANLSLANASWGSVPEMITLKSFSADVDPWSLWQGIPLYHHLRAEGLRVVLERDEQGVGNWKFGDPSSSESSAKEGGFALIPKNRTQFPTLLDMVMKDALITYRTYSGNILRIQLDNVAIQSESDDTPVTLKASGAYNNTSLILDAKTQSFIVLRDGGTPFGTILNLAGRTAKLDFDGTMMEPLDFDGVDGSLKLNAAELDNLLASFGAEMLADYPLLVGGHLTRQGDHWELTKTKGRIADNDFTGTLILDEGSKGAPDSIATDLAFGTLDLNQLIVEDPNAKQQSVMDMRLLAPQDAGVNLDAKLTAAQLAYGKLKLDDVALDGLLTSGNVALKNLSFGYAGGRISAATRVKSTAESSDVVADVEIKGIETDRLMQAIGATAGDLTGKLNGAAHLAMQGGTLGAALKTADGAAVLTMTQGSVSRAIIEQASTDLRALFREREGSSPIECLAGVVIVKDGIATLAPLRLQAKDATLIGSGTIDLKQQRLEISAKSERASTGFFALDLPVKISGPFDKLSAGLGGDAEKKWQPLAGADIAKLDPEIKRLAAGNACLK